MATMKKQVSALKVDNIVPAKGGGVYSRGVKYKAEDDVPMNVNGKMVKPNELPAQKTKKPPKFFQKAKTRGE